MGLAWYESNGTTPVTATHAFGSVAAGSASTAWEPWIYYNKGTNGGEATNVTLSVQAYISSVWVSSGVSVLDQSEIEIRIKGYAATGDSTWVAPVTTLRQRVGTDRPFSIGTIPGNCGVQLEIVYAPRLQSGTASTSVTIQFPVVYNELVSPLVAGVNEGCGYGVLTGCGDPYHSGWVIAPLATETGTPDDYVQVSRGWWVGQGVSRRVIASSVQLNQNDVTPAALSAGQAYYALISQPIIGGALVATKGTKATAGSQTVPTIPADSLAVALVTVLYGAGGSVIENADIEQIAADGRLLVSDAGTLDVTIAKGRALTRRGLVDRPLAETLTLTDDATSVVYLEADGTLSDEGGDVALASVVCSSGDITGITDLRRYVEPGLELIRLEQSGNETAGTVIDRVLITRRCSLDRVWFGLRSASSGGATGATTLDINKGGTTVFTNQGGSPETRPSIAASSTSDTDAWPEVTTVAAGDWLTLDVDAITSTGTRAIDIEAHLWLMPY